MTLDRIEQWMKKAFFYGQQYDVLNYPGLFENRPMIITRYDSQDDPFQ